MSGLRRVEQRIEEVRGSLGIKGEMLEIVARYHNAAEAVAGPSIPTGNHGHRNSRGREPIANRMDAEASHRCFARDRLVAS